MMMRAFYLLHLLGVANSFSPACRAPRTLRSTLPTGPSTVLHRFAPSTRSTFSSSPAASSTMVLSLHSGMESHLLSSPMMVPASSFLLSQADDVSASWRQYVPVVVIGLVLIDILLGSPFANSILNKARPDSMNDDNSLNNLRSSQESLPDEVLDSMALRSQARGGGGGSSSSKPRIDVDAYAKAALERAEGVTQLREYLDSRKTDWDRMEDMKRQMDQKMEELDRKNRND